MLKNRFVKMGFFMVLALLFVLPAGRVWAGALTTIPDTDFPEDQIYAYWDLRGRESFVQVTNTIPVGITVHVQVFNAATGCAEFDFFDSYTGNDTFVYNVRALARNNGVPLAAPILTDGFGFVVVSQLANLSLIGNFRVIDASGYEYRTNTPGNFEGATLANTHTFNFNAPASADVIGFAADADFQTTVIPGAALFDPVTLFDTIEQDISCDPVVFACNSSLLNRGINQAIPNSRGASSICLGTDTTGYVDLTFAQFGGADFFVGLIGINNGDGTGSMDSWWGTGVQIIVE